ncbi:MAG TPA: caspase family protein, partial [Propylenella sp.]
ITDYNRVIELQPTFVGGYINRGVAHVRQGDLNRGIIDFDRAIRLSPEDGSAHLGRGLAYQAQGDFHLALTDLRSAERLLAAGDPQHEIVRQSIASIETRPTPATPTPAVKQPSPITASRVTGGRVALVVGIDGYRELPTLRKAVGDARAFASALKNLGYHVTEIHDPDRRTLNQAISSFSTAAAAADIALVHFSGHGVAIDGENYLLAADAPKPASGAKDFVKAEAIGMSALIARISDSGARTRIFVIDACRDNPFELLGVRSVGATRGLARIEEVPAGTFVMYSAGYRQTALDHLGPSDIEPTSVYMRVLLKHLARPGIALDDIAQDVRVEVEQLARSIGHNQRPAYYDELSGRVFLMPDESADGGTAATEMMAPMPTLDFLTSKPFLPLPEAAPVLPHGVTP